MEQRITAIGGNGQLRGGRRSKNRVSLSDAIANVLGRPYLFTSYDSASGPAVQKNQVKREFNALGQLTSEWQDHDSAVDASSLSATATVRTTPTTTAA